MQKKLLAPAHPGISVAMPLSQPIRFENQKELLYNTGYSVVEMAYWGTYFMFIDAVSAPFMYNNNKAFGGHYVDKR